MFEIYITISTVVTYRNSLPLGKANRVGTGSEIVLFICYNYTLQSKINQKFNSVIHRKTGENMIEVLQK